MYTLPTAPLSIGGILDDGFKLFRASWRQLLPVAIVTSLVSTAPQLMITGMQEFKPGVAPGGFALGAGAIAVFLMVIVLSIVTYAVMLAGVDRVARVGAVSLQDAVSIGVRRAPTLFRTSLLVTLAVLLGLVLLVLPGLYLMVALYPVLLLPIAERLGARQSFKRAYHLVKGSWWRTAGVLSVMSLIFVALFLILGFLTGLATLPFIDVKNPQEAAGTVVAIQFVAALVVAPLLPLTYCVMYAVYTDLRLRKDGGDLLERAAAARG